MNINTAIILPTTERSLSSSNFRPYLAKYLQTSLQYFSIYLRNIRDVKDFSHENYQKKIRKAIRIGKNFSVISFNFCTSVAKHRQMLFDERNGIGSLLTKSHYLSRTNFEEVQHVSVVEK